MADAPSPPTKIITYQEYFKKNISLDAYRLVELKYLAKHYKLHVSGCKRVLMERIRECFLQMNACEQIQRYFRGHMVRYWIRLRGPATLDRNKCVNETDFYTMDPISEIPIERFFSYADDQSFIYGFDIFSLLSLFQKSKQIVNPYNRETIAVPLAFRMLSFYAISNLLFDHSNDSLDNDLKKLSNRPNERPEPAVRRRRYARRVHPPAVQELLDENTLVEETTAIPPHEPVFPIREDPDVSHAPTERAVPAMDLSDDPVRLLQSIRSKPWEVRARELFMEMDQLGNYTTHIWFTELSKLQYARLYENLYIWWELSRLVPSHLKSMICRIPRVFAEAHLIRLYPTTTMEKYRELSLDIMEALVFTGASIEYRKLGAMHVLTVLTTVSASARNQLPWLFESIPHRVI